MSISFTEQLADQHELQIKRTIQDLERRIVALISGALNEQDIITTQIAIELRADIKRFINETFTTTADSIVREYDKAVESFMREFGKLNIPENFKFLTQVDADIITQLKYQSFAGFEQIANRYLTEISANVYQNAIAGKPFVDMVKDIRGLLTGDVDRIGRPMTMYASQIAHDSLLQFDGQFTVYKAKEAGIDRYRYVGTLVKDSRDHCVRYLNRVLSENEIRLIWQRNWSGKAEGDPFVVRGGYRCRHKFEPVVED
jgi:hypothetical protein